MIERPRGVHLCGNPDWDFLLELDLDILSLDVYSNGEVFVSYATSIKKFLEKELGLELTVPEEPQITGALGAALVAKTELEKSS